MSEVVVAFQQIAQSIKAFDKMPQPVKDPADPTGQRNLPHPTSYLRELMRRMEPRNRSNDLVWVTHAGEQLKALGYAGTAGVLNDVFVVSVTRPGQTSPDLYKMVGIVNDGFDDRRERLKLRFPTITLDAKSQFNLQGDLSAVELKRYTSSMKPPEVAATTKPLDDIVLSLVNHAIAEGPHDYPVRLLIKSAKQSYTDLNRVQRLRELVQPTGLKV